MSVTAETLAETPIGAKAGASGFAARGEAPSSIWFDGELLPADSQVIALNTHALHYGSGVFEGIRAYATRRGPMVFRLPEHLERMRKGAELLGMTFDPAVASTAVLDTLRDNLARNRRAADHQAGDAYIRPLAWYGAGGFGLDVTGRDSHLMVATSATNLHLNGARARVAVSRWRRNPADSLPPLKLCGAYVNSILAKREARLRGFDEAMFVDADGDTVECTGANLFMVRRGLVTAIEHRDALPGITRDTLIRLLGAESRTVSLQELLEADEVFACGTAAEVAPIAEISDLDANGEEQGRRYGDNPVTREIAALYARTVQGETAQSSAWLTGV